MIGKTISQYKILEELGRGGMGVVYKAIDLDLERAVAVKFLPPHLSRDEDARQRFIHEAKSASALDHQHIGTIYEIGRTDDVQTFIVMAYYEGETLRERIDRGSMSTEEALDIATQVASGLARAHKKDIVHRDIKPSNIIITKDREAKIIDFGLAKLAGKTKLTKEGSTLGTAAYMSPEQARGEDVDHRSDIFSLGSILYEMLAGEPPFKGEHEAALLYCIVHEEQKALTTVQPKLPGPLADIVNKCLAKDPSDRFERTGELADHLRGLVRDTASGVSGRPAKTSTRKSRVAVVAAAICITAVVVFLLSDYFRDRGLREMQPEAVETELTDRWAQSIAVLPFRDLSPGKDQEHVCLGFTDAVNGILSAINELKVISTTSVMRFKETEVDIKDIGAELGVGNILEGTVQREGDRIRVRAQLIETETGFHLWADTYDERFESVFDVQDRISNAIAQSLKLELVPGPKGRTEPLWNNIEAYEYYMKGMYFAKSKYVITFNEADFRAGRDMFNRAIEIDPGYAMAHAGLARAYEHQFPVPGSKSDADSMQIFTEKAYALDPESAIINAVKGYLLYEHKNERDEAFEFFQKALEINPNVGEVNFIAGACFLYMGLYEQALRFLERASALDPYYLWTPYKIAVCYMNMGEPEKAAQHFEEYFELAPVVLIFPGRYIALMVQMNNIERVEEFIRDTEDSHPDYSLLPYCKALLHAALGEKEQALALYRNSEIYAVLDMKDEAIEALRGEIRGTSAIPYIFYRDLLINPFYENLRDDERFIEIIEEERALYDEYTARYSHFKNL